MRDNDREKDNNTIKLLVLGAGGNVSQGIIKALRKAEFGTRRAEIFGACISAESLGLFFCDSAEISPYANEKGFLPWLTEFCRRERIQMVLTGVEENIMAIKEQFAEFEKGTEALFIASDLEKLKIGQDKLLTCRWLEENGLRFPKYCKADAKEEAKKLAEECGFPLIGKPRIGKGSMGVCKIESMAEFEKVLGREDYVIEECIGDETKEYTVGCYVDKMGILKDTIVMHRKLEHGSTAMAEVVEDTEVKAEAERICQAFAPKGPLNIQMRKNKKGEAVCFELNVRFSGTTPMRAHFGFKDVEAMVKEYLLGEPVEDCFHIKKGIACRYTNECYMTGNPIEELKQKGRLEALEPYNVEQDG